MALPLSKLLGEHSAIIGKTFSGKTTFALWLFTHLPKGSKGIFINTQAEDRVRDFADVTVNELSADVLLRYDRINFVPPIDIFGNSTDLVREVKLIFAHQRVYYEKNLPLRRIFVFVDEAHEYAPRNQPNPLRVIWKRGLRFKVHGIAITQRPTDIDKVILTQSRFLVIFGLNAFEVDVFRHYGLSKIYQNFDELRKRLTGFRFAVYDTVNDTLSFFSPVRL